MRHPDMIPLSAVKITKRSEHVEQACRVYGEEWRDILFKKWTYNHVTRPENCGVYLVVSVTPSINTDHLYDTVEEATAALREVLRERLERILNKTYWRSVQPFTYWECGLEDDLWENQE